MPCGIANTAETRWFPLGHPQVIEPHQGGILPQQAHHHGLAVDHGNDGDAHVHLAAFEPDLDPAVLRQAFFGDVQVR
jgi:hypothetical protein